MAKITAYRAVDDGPHVLVPFQSRKGTIWSFESSAKVMTTSGEMLQLIGLRKMREHAIYHNENIVIGCGMLDLNTQPTVFFVDDVFYVMAVTRDGSPHDKRGKTLFHTVNISNEQDIFDSISI